MRGVQSSEFRIKNSLSNQQFNEHPIRNSFRPGQQNQSKKNFKIYVWVIIASVLIGIVIFFLTRGANKVASPTAPQQNPTEVSATTEKGSAGYYPSPSSRPTPPPLDENSDLEAEAEKLDPKDYSGEFKNLRDQI